MFKIYAYKNCATCQKTLKFLKEKNIPAEILDIRETPPSIEELKKMHLSLSSLRLMLNTSSKDYREIKTSLEKMSEEEVFDVLSKRGNLIKRPFILGEKINWVGHKPENFLL